METLTCGHDSPEQGAGREPCIAQLTISLGNLAVTRAPLRRVWRARQLALRRVRHPPRNSRPIASEPMQLRLQATSGQLLGSPKARSVVGRFGSVGFTGGHLVAFRLSDVTSLANGAVGAAAVAVNAIAGSNVVEGSLTQADLSDAPKVISVENLSPSGINLPNNTMTVVSQVSVAAPAAGRVIVSTSGSFHFDNPNTPDHTVCSITTGVVTGYPAAARAGEWNPADLLYVPFGGTRAFTVAAGSSTTFRLVCWASGSSISVVGAELTALFVAGS